MKKAVLFLLFTFCFLQLRSQTSYYFSQDGCDTNNGMTPSTAFKTLTKFNNTSFSVGDTVHFRNGDKWESGKHISLSDGVTLTNYEDINSPSQEKPIISNMVELDNIFYTDGDNYKQTIQSSNNEDIKINRLFAEDSEGNLIEYLQSTILEDLNILSYGLDSNFSNQEWFYESLTSSSGILYITENIEGLILKAANKYFTIIINNKRDIVIENLDIRGSFGPSIFIKKSNNITIKNCSIGKYSRLGIRANGNCDNIKISDSEIDSGWASNLFYGQNSQNCNLYDDNCLKQSEERGLGDGILFEEGVQNSRIKNCRINNWGHAAIYLKGADNLFNGVNNNVIENNIVSGATISYGRGFASDGINHKCRNNIIRYNRFEDWKNKIQFNGNDNIFHHNIIRKTRNAPTRPDEYPNIGQGMKLNTYQTGFVCYNNKIDNNVFSDIESHGIVIENSTNEVNDIYIRNNIFIYEDNLNTNQGEEVASIYINSGIPTNNNIHHLKVQNNLLYNLNDGANLGKIYYRAQGFISIDSVSPSQYDIFTGNVSEDPEFTYNVNDHYCLVDQTSICINGGINTEYMNDPLVTDYDGDLFPVLAPDIGVQEFRKKVILIEDPLKSKVQINKDILIYPNPTNSKLHFSSNRDIASIKVFDLSGKQLNIQIDKSNFIDVEKLNPGVYFLVLNIGGESISRKFVKI